MKKKDSPKINDVAKKANVSSITVYRVLRNRELVKEDTAKKVESAMNELNFKWDENTINTKKKNRNLAVLIPDILDPFFSMLTKGIGDIAHRYNYNILIYYSDNSHSKEEENIELILSSNILGAIIVPSSVDKSIYTRITDKSIPFVFLDRFVDMENCNYIISDDKEGACLATKYLLDLGHEKILYIGGDKRLSTEHNRLIGYKEALKDKEIDICQELIHECEFSAQTAYKVVKKIIQQNIYFTAAFGASDIIAFGIKKALEENGSLIPKDISLIGYGDTPLSMYISLTTVSSPAYEMGKNAFIYLIDITKQRIKEPAHLVLRPSVIFRSTCKNYINK